MAWPILMTPIPGALLAFENIALTILAMIMMTTVTQVTPDHRTALTLTIAITVTPSMTLETKETAPGALEMKVDTGT